MIANKKEAMEFINENDVEFIRLQFCDIFGELKNISIMSDGLKKAFDFGISFDASNFKGFLNIDESDLFLVPDPKTLSVLPWRPQQGRVARFLCDIRKADGSIFEGDSRAILKASIEKAKKKNYDFFVGPECEFYLFKTNEEGNPTLIPHDLAGYFGMAPHDKGENIRRDICLTLKEMGIGVENSHHEVGTGQHEIDIKYEDALASADNFITLKSVIKTLSTRSGLYASFMPKPLENAIGSGLHINMSLLKNGENIFKKAKDKELCKEAESFIAGIIAHIKGISLFSNPLINSYKRILSGFETSEYLSHSYKNRSKLIRIPVAKADESRIELRSPDPSLNPYITFALLLEAGLYGIEQKLSLSDVNAIEMENSDKLPSNLYEAICYAQEDELIKNVIGKSTFDKYVSIKLLEWESYQKAVSGWEIENYFQNI